jgi:hypothetical protein
MPRCTPIPSSQYPGTKHLRRARSLNAILVSRFKLIWVVWAPRKSRRLKRARPLRKINRAATQTPSRRRTLCRKCMNIRDRHVQSFSQDLPFTGHTHRVLRMLRGCCIGLQGTQAGRLGRAGYQRSAAVGDGMIKQFEHEPKRREVLFVDSTIVVAIQRVADDGIGLALHDEQFLD